jgi:hypothetical protein
MPGLRELRSLTLGDPGTRVAVIDGPPDLEHDCFAGAAIETAPMPVLRSSEPADWAVEHATAIASTLVGQPGSAVEGICPRITLLAVEGARDEEGAYSETRLAAAIELALAHSPDIIHCAFCVPSQSSTIGDMLGRALAKVAAAGVLLVAPAGNNSGESFCAPADQEGVLAVGGLDDDGTVRESSNHGRRYESHGVMAWAENLWTAVPGGGAKRQSGTSGAAAVATGIAALLVSAVRNAGVEATPAEIGAAMRATARPLDDEAGRGRAIGGVVDPPAALRAVVGSYRPATASGGVEPSLRLPSRLFVLGQLAVDLPDEAARERLAARMAARDGDGRLDPGRPEDLRALHEHLRLTPQDASLVTWVLTLNGAPRYALEPAGPHSTNVHTRLIAVLGAGSAAAQANAAIERVSIPGVVTVRSQRLSSGERVPVALVTRAPAISAWRTADLVAAVHGPMSDEAALAATSDLLARIYNEHRNEGTRGPDRALNFAGTNAVQAALAARQATDRGLRLDRLTVDKSRFDRPRSECWDVQAWFHDPEDPRRAPWVWVWTIDVADAPPVSLGAPRSWSTAG